MSPRSTTLPRPNGTTWSDHAAGPARPRRRVMGILIALLALTAAFAAGALAQRGTDQLATPPTVTEPPPEPGPGPEPEPTISAPSPSVEIATPMSPTVTLPPTGLSAVPFRCSADGTQMVRIGEDGSWTDPAGLGELVLTAATTAILPQDTAPSTIAAVTERCAGASDAVVTLILTRPSGSITLSEPGVTNGLQRADRIDVTPAGLIEVRGLISPPGGAPGPPVEGALQFRCGADGFEQLPR